MNLTKTLMATSALALAAGGATAQEMADDMTLVSWGGAYQASQQNAYVEPYLEMNPGVSAAWDESSNEAVAKLRAMKEAGCWAILLGAESGVQKNLNTLRKGITLDQTRKVFDEAEKRSGGMTPSSPIP